jgi:hypothetical protein
MLTAVVFLLGGVSVALPQELPTDPEKLFEYAQACLNDGDWKESDRAFRAYLEKFPEGKRVEEVLFGLGNLNLWHRESPARAREWYGKLCEKFPASPNYWNYRFSIAQSYQQQDLKQKAKEEYTKISKEAKDPQVRVNAIQCLWGLENKYFYLNVNQTFTAGQEPAVRASLRNIDRVDYRVTRISYGDVLERLKEGEQANLHEAISKVGKEGRKILKEWTARYAYPNNEQWREEEVKVPSTESGVYIVEGVHEEVTMTVTVLVARHGLIAKAAAGKLLCFAQDRVTSKPVEGLEVRILSPGGPLKGRTDANGLFMTADYKGGLVVGVKDGEVIPAEAGGSGSQDAQPLVHVTTDRPIYRPRQLVHFRVVHRMEQGDRLSLRPGDRLWVEIRDPKGNKVYEQKHALNDFGSISGRFALGDEPSLGEYSVFTRTEQDDANLHQHEWQWLQFEGPGPHHFGRFRVDEYRKPEYKVEVEFKKSPVIQGDEVEATVRADYYFGSPVADAEITWTVHRRYHWWYWRWWAYYCDWYVDEDGEEAEERHHRRWGGAGEEVHRGQGRTDKDGRFPVRFHAQKWDHDAVYTVTAQVTDLSRRVVQGSGTCKATRAEFGLVMTMDKYVYKPGERMNAKVRAATADDKTVADAKITLRAYDRHWKSGNWDDQRLFEGESRTDAQGVAEFNLSSELEGGYIYLVAEARDSKENRVTAEYWVWLCGVNWGGDAVNLNGIDLVPGKKAYSPGETAQILITSQFKNLTFLFTVEGKEVYHHEVVSMKGHTKTVEFKVDRPAYAPNVYVCVTALKENQVVQRQKMLIVDPSAKFVTVEVKPDKAQYRPRQKAVYEVVTKGADGRPVAAEVALGVVDESIYALQDEYAADIRKHFIHRTWNQVGTATSLSFYEWGRADIAEGKDAGGLVGATFALNEARPAAASAKMEKEAGGSGGGKKAYAATEVRSNFADTMLWKTVVTGADGRAVVEVDIPDNLTTWRATARASTADSRFGQETNSVVCRKSMIVRLETPRFFTQNDETVVSAIAHNYLAGEKEVKIEFDATGIEVAGEKEMLVKVAPNGQKRIDWKARVRAPGLAKITVKALSDEDSDAMQLTVPVLPHGSMKWESKAGIVDGRVVEKLVLPPGPVQGTTELTVGVCPTHASMVLDALEYLAGYPYGCVEQTMSRFLPTVIASRALQNLGIRDPGLEEEIPHMVAAGLQRLYNFQHEDGGWGWWERDASNPWITAYVISGLAMARGADHAVEEQVWARGLQALRNQLAEAKEADLQVYLLYALSVAGQKEEAVRDRLAGDLEKLNPYGKALLALVLHQDGKDARRVLEALAKEALVTGAAAHFQGLVRGRWMDDSAESTAAALRAFLKVDPKHELVPRMIHWLSQVRQDRYWGSTKQTAMAVYAITDYLAISGDLNPDMTITLTVNGKQVYSQRVTKENWRKFEGTRRFGAEHLREGENEVVIEKMGNGAPAWSVYLKRYVEAEDIAASQGGIRIERKYSRVVHERGERRLVELGKGAQVVSGDEVEVTLAVTADRDYEWLMMEDPLPSGFEPVREYWGHYGWHWNYWYSRKEFHDEKVSIGMSQLGQGTHTVTYTMRAETPGDFHVLPAAAFNMYHPEIGGNSAESRIRVKDRN